MTSVIDPLADIISRLQNVKKNGAGYTARCPAHEDRRNSLSVRAGDDGRVLVHCFVGCEPERIVAALGLTLADLFPPRAEAIRGNGADRRQRGEGPSIPSDNTATAQHAGLTLAQYAAAKQLDPDPLRGFGLSEMAYLGKLAVRIPYLDEAGQEGPVRIRLALDKSANGDNRFVWRKGSKLCLYGRNRLALARQRCHVVLAEGESDCHTLWQHGEPALGIPGAANWNEARDAPVLDGIPIIYVVIEPDQGGEAMLKWLAGSRIRDRVKLVSLGPYKDLSALHCAGPAQFAERWEAAKVAAIPLAERLDAERQADADAAWDTCKDLAREPDILSRAAETVAELGVAGEREAVRLVFLAVVSRLLAKPVNVAVKGPSSAGKSFLVEQTLRLFPDEAYFALTAMSERALAYSDEPIKHRMLVLYEAAGQSGDLGSYLMRSLLSEGRIRYLTVDKTPAGMRPRLIEREGPTGLIVTTTKASLHPENETRMLSVTVADTKEQTRAIFHALANGHGPVPALVPWHALQHWLSLGECRVDIPFAAALSVLVPPVAVRLRRDFGLLLTLIRAHALLHRATRELAPDGAIRATVDDYEAVRRLVEPLIAAGVEATVSAAMRETVAAVGRLCPGADDTASLAAVAKELRLDKSTTSRRLTAAKERGYLVNRQEKRGQAAQYAIGESLPEETAILPDRCSVAALFGEGAPPPPSPHDEDPFGDDPFASARAGEPGNDRWTA